MSRKTQKKLKVVVIVLVCLSSLYMGWPQQAADFVGEIVDAVQGAAPDFEGGLPSVSHPIAPGEVPDSFNPVDFDGNLEVHFIDVGNADSILIKCDGEAALIDAGENDCGDLVVNYLKDQGITKLKYAVGTHPHSDHIGGLDNVINELAVEVALLPAKEHTTKTYQNVLTAIRDNKTTLITPDTGDNFYVGGAKFTVLSPDREWDDLNNNSIVLYLENGEDSFLFTGDAEIQAEDVMLDAGIVPEADVLKVGHHGSSTSTGYRWLWTVMPKYCVIPCGDGNKYGHPHKEVMSRLSDHSKVNGTVVYRSDKNGNIVAYSSGAGNIQFSAAKGSGWSWASA